MVTTQERSVNSGERFNVNSSDRRPRTASVKVLGIGGAGCNAVSRAYRRNPVADGYYCLTADQQSINRIEVPNKVLLGPNVAGGEGTNGFPEIGQKAAEESAREIDEIVRDADVAVVIGGLGGGTGTGALPVVVDMAKASGASVVLIVTQPSSLESEDRIRYSDQALGRLKEQVDSLIVVSHDKIINSFGLGLWDVFNRADSIIDQGIQTIIETASETPIRRKGELSAVKAVLSIAILPILS